MPAYTDQTGNTIFPDKIPQRIVSLVPSQTELLYDLGLNHEVAGITKFCVHPAEWQRTKTITGGTKQVNIETIHSLRPDLIIANKEENVKEQVEELSKHYPVWISDVSNYDTALEMIQAVGDMTGKADKAASLIESIKQEFTNYETTNKSYKKRSCCYLIWQKPFMTIGSDTFIHSMLEKAGFTNVFTNKFRYPETTISEIQNLKPEVLLLSSEPFPFRQKHIDELQPFFPYTKILLADGEMFSWYGSRLIKSCAYFKELLQFV